MSEIILYSTGCSRCEVLKKKLNNKQITYTENDNVETMLDLGISSVPMLAVNGELMDFSTATKWINEQ